MLQQNGQSSASASLTKPVLMQFQGQHTKKSFYEKEASETWLVLKQYLLMEHGIDIHTGAHPELNKVVALFDNKLDNHYHQNESNVILAVLANKGLRGQKNQYKKGTLAYAVSLGNLVGAAKLTDRKAKNFISNMNRAVMSWDAKYRLLMSLFAPIIQQERAYAVLSASFVRLLAGPTAPKVKLRQCPNDPVHHLKLLSQLVPHSVDLTELKSDVNIQQHAHQIAAAALIRYLVGCEFREMRLQNFLYVKESDRVEIIPIDTDFAFDPKVHEVLPNITLDNAGAKMLFPAGENDPEMVYVAVPYRGNNEIKKNWDNIFTADNEADVKNAMLDVWKRAAVLLTDAVITKFVTHVLQSVALSDEDRDHVINMMNNVRIIALNKLAQAQVDPTQLTIEQVTPWAPEMLEKLSHHKPKVLKYC